MILAPDSFLAVKVSSGISSHTVAETQNVCVVGTVVVAVVVAAVVMIPA